MSIVAFIILVALSGFNFAGCFIIQEKLDLCEKQRDAIDIQSVCSLEDNCEEFKNDLQLFSKQQEEFVRINNEILTESVFYTQDGHIYPATCTEIFNIKLVNDSFQRPRCTRDQPVKYYSKDDEVLGYINKQKVVSTTTLEVICKAERVFFFHFKKGDKLYSLKRSDYYFYISVNQDSSLIASTDISWHSQFSKNLKAFVKEDLGMSPSAFRDLLIVGLAVFVLLFVLGFAFIYICFCQKGNGTDFALFARLIAFIAVKSSFSSWLAKTIEEMDSAQVPHGTRNGPVYEESCYNNDDRDQHSFVSVPVVVNENDIASNRSDSRAKCKICNREFNSARGLQVHQNRMHHK